MRKTNQEIKDPGIIEEILKGAEICRIAMMDDDVPYLLPFNYGYMDRSIYIHAAPAGKKIDLLKKNNKVCFEVEHTAKIIPQDAACRWATLYRSVVGYGEVEIVEDFEDKKQGLGIIMAHYGAPDQIIFDPKEVNSVVILKLNVTSLTGKQSSNWDKVSNQ